MGLQDVKGEGMGETLKGDDGILQEEKRTEDRGSWKTTGRDKDGMCRGRRKARLVSQRPRQGRVQRGRESNQPCPKLLRAFRVHSG